MLHCPPIFNCFKVVSLVFNKSDQVPSPNHATGQFGSEEVPATPNITSSLPSNSNATHTIAQANESLYITPPEEDRNAPEQIDLAVALMKTAREELSLATLDTVVFIPPCYR